MDNQRRVELTIKRKRIGVSHFQAECAGVVGSGPTSAAALTDCVARLGRIPEFLGLFWRDDETGMSGEITGQRKRRTAAKVTGKGAVFDLLGGKMNGTYRMKDEPPRTPESR